MGGIPPPSGGIVGKNWSTQRKTTVSSKRVGPLGSNGAPLLGSHSDNLLFQNILISSNYKFLCLTDIVIMFQGMHLQLQNFSNKFLLGYIDCSSPIPVSMVV